MIHGWSNPWIWNFGYGGPVIKLYMDFYTVWRVGALTTTLFKGQLYLEIKLNKEAKELYMENNKTFLREIKEDINKWKEILCS